MKIKNANEGIIQSLTKKVLKSWFWGLNSSGKFDDGCHSVSKILPKIVESHPLIFDQVFIHLYLCDCNNKKFVKNVLASLSSPYQIFFWNIGVNTNWAIKLTKAAFLGQKICVFGNFMAQFLFPPIFWKKIW